MVIDLSTRVTQKRFGDLVGISQQAVSDMVSQGIVAEGATVGEWLIAYCSRLREQAAGRAAAGDLDLAAERAALAKAHREKIEMQNAVTRNELAPVYLIEQVLSAAASRIAGILEAIPGMIRRRVPALSADDINLIASEIAKARNTIAGISIHEIEEAVADEEGLQQ